MRERCRSPCETGRHERPNRNRAGRGDRGGAGEPRRAGRATRTPRRLPGGPRRGQRHRRPAGPGAADGPPRHRRPRRHPGRAAARPGRPLPERHLAGLAREFVDDLLDGRNPGDLAERAERFGLRLAGSTVVAAARAAEPVIDGGEVSRDVETALHLRLGSRDVLVTTKDGLLVCVAPEAMGEAPEEFARQVAAALGTEPTWRVGLGRPQPGPGGPVRSFEQARNALDIAQRLDLPGRVHRAADLLVYRVLLRDSAALADLVDAVLEPLRRARGGPGPLLDTLAAYFAAGRVATACARELHVGVRTVTYRLQRVRELTGYAADDPRQGFTLQTAVLGAKLLSWNGQGAPEPGNHPG
ncbi:PucR family transcriptional regulator [Saccharothrix lopnurensis]|uniref:PucR family transcriptional regulator n=1 Tax=Saccharothrix lopnurensis TaxID=1670621 RepID=A0ABW1NXE4_9PSEU